jgi:hypothetical protein
VLGRRLYDIAAGPDGESSTFIAKYYPALGKASSGQSKALAKLMFLPSLVGTR